MEIDTSDFFAEMPKFLGTGGVIVHGEKPQCLSCKTLAGSGIVSPQIVKSDTDSESAGLDKQIKMTKQLAEDMVIEIFKKRDKVEISELTALGIGQSPVLIKRKKVKSAFVAMGFVVKKRGHELEKITFDSIDISPENYFENNPNIVVDDYYWFPPDESDLLQTMITAKMNVLLVGPTGGGKTVLATKLLDKNNLSYKRMNLNGEVSIDDFVGFMELKKDGDGSETVFNYGILPQAMREGEVLIIDELDAAPPEILFILQSVLEGNPLVLTKTGGEIIMPKDGFKLIATANTVGKGDDSALYQGTQILNEAFLDRWGGVIRLDYMPKNREVIVLVKRTGIGLPDAKAVVEIAGLCRKAMKEKRIYSTFSTRKLLNMCTLLKLGVKRSKVFEVVVLNKVIEEDRAVMCEIYQRITGEVIKWQD